MSDRIFLGGYPGAGKTALTRYLVKENNWYSLDMDNKDTNRVLELLDAPAGHPEFKKTPLVVEGGFLEQAPKFQRLILQHGMTTFWLTGSRENLEKSRLNRGAFWDDPYSIKNGDWMNLVDKYRKVVRWDYQIEMWHQDGSRKEFYEVAYEINSCLDGKHRAYPRC